MSLPALRRVAQRSILNHLPSRTISSTSIRCASTAEDIKKRLYDADLVRLSRRDPRLALLNEKLETRAQDRNLVGVINLWNSALERKIKPDALSYGILLRCFASYGLFDAAVRVFGDMLAMGVGDKRQGLNYVLEAAAADPVLEAKALQMFKQYGCDYDAVTYQHLLEALARRENLERALQLLSEMEQAGVAPNRECVQVVIRLAIVMRMPQLAMEMAINSGNASDVVTDELMMSILMSGAAELHAEVVQWAWNVVRKTKSLPTEPLCVEVLNTACRHGLPELALSVLECLQEGQIMIMEHHIAPLVGAYCAAGQLREAFLALDKFQEFNVSILPESASSIVTSISKSSSDIDNAWDTLSQLPRPVNIEAVNATLQAAVNLSDMQRAIGIYKELGDLECAPTKHTFDILLAGCLGISHAELGERLFEDMLSRKIKPSIQTFSRLILLSLTQKTYESAFTRLEEMKRRNMTPPARVYEALVMRCVQERDLRAELALEEMTICGYKVSPSLRDFLLRKDESGQEGREWSGEQGVGEVENVDSRQ